MSASASGAPSVSTTASASLSDSLVTTAARGASGAMGVAVADHSAARRAATIESVAHEAACVAARRAAEWSATATPIAPDAPRAAVVTSESLREALAVVLTDGSPEALADTCLDERETSASWRAICGQAEAKARLQQALEGLVVGSAARARARAL